MPGLRIHRLGPHIDLCSHRVARIASFNLLERRPLRAFSRLSAVGWIRVALGQHTPDRVAHQVRFIQRDVVAAALGDDYAAVLETRDELALMPVPVVLQLITQRAGQYAPSVAHDDDGQTDIQG
jgi:hypothetical protein